MGALEPEPTPTIVDRIFDQLFGGCLGRIIVILIFCAGVFAGVPIANGLGIPPQRGKDGLFVYGLIGLAATGAVVLPILAAVRAVVRRKRNVGEKRSAT